MESEDPTTLVVIITSGERSTFCIVPARCPVSISGITVALDRIRKAVHANEHPFINRLSVEYSSWLKEPKSDFSPENEHFGVLLQTYGVRPEGTAKADVFRRSIVVHISLPVIKPGPEMYVFKENEWDAFDELLAKSPKMVINVSASWCPPCRNIYPTFAELARSHHSADVTFVRILLEDLAPAHKRFKFQTVPTFAFAINGKVRHERTLQNSDPETVKNTVYEFLDEHHETRKK